jgi:predicted transcriptional regulator YheO
MKNKIILIWIIILIIIAAYYYQLELASIAYLCINMLINNLEHLSNYLKDYLEIDSPIKEVSADNKLIDNNLNKSSITININHPSPEESIPFYKSKPFIICGIIIITSTLVYLYFNSPTSIFGDSDDSKLVNKLLDIIKQKDEKLLDVIYDKDLKFYRNNNKLINIIYQKVNTINQLRESALKREVKRLEHIVRQSEIRRTHYTDELLDILD